MRRSKSESGMSLAEVLVASALALVGFLVALILYQAARQSFKKGELATDQQQEVRVAYDRMMRDLRLGGYNWNATGEDRPGEEQIEGAWTGAITVRGDFDFEDGTLSRDPEDLIAGSTNKATVGNDEIVTFCLRKSNGSGGAALAFNADVNSTTAVTSATYGSVSARDGVSDAVSVPGVYNDPTSAQTTPPYALYRVVLNNARSTYGSATFYTYQLLAENIKSLSFKYYDANGVEITAPGGAETTAATDDRAKIRKVTVTVIGMTATADQAYTDTSDSNTASQHFRKFSLSSQVTPRNLGFKGRADSDSTPPTVPTGLAVCAGHCGGLLLSWTANPSTEAVTQYELKYGLTAGTMTSVASTSGTSLFVSSLTMGATYYFAIRAADGSGNRSSYSGNVSTVVADNSTYPTHTVPSAPAGFTATGHGGVGGVTGKVDLAWTGVTTNEQTLSCDPAGTLLRDGAGYRLYRSLASTYTPSSSTLIIDESNDGTPQTAILNATATSYTDAGVVNCRPYYYHLKTFDNATCGYSSTTWGASYDGKGMTTVLPAAPTNVTAARTSPSSALVGWTATAQDTDLPPVAITIDTYKVWRAQLANNADPEAATYTLVGTTTVPPYTYSDTSAPAESGSQKLYYKISAIDDCPNESLKSLASVTSCTFNGALGMSPVTGTYDPTPKTITITASGTDTYTQANLTVVKTGGTTDENNTMVATGTSWVFTWTPNQGPGVYTATGTVTNSNGCSSNVSRTYTISIGSCDTCAQFTLNDPDPSSGSLKYYRQQNTVPNNCAFDLSITNVKIRARTICTGGCTTPMKLLKIQYLPTCAGGTNANKSCTVTADCPGSTCTTTTFASETNNVVYTAAGTGDNVAVGTTAIATFSSPYITLPASSNYAKFRWIFNTATPVWVGSTASKQSILEGDVCFIQTSNLCTPACITNIKLETQP